MITATLVYLSIGSGVWLILDGLGIIEDSFVEHPSREARAMVLATAMLIVGWPAFVFLCIKDMWRPSA